MRNDYFISSKTNPLLNLKKSFELSPYAKALSFHKVDKKNSVSNNKSFGMKNSFGMFKANTLVCIVVLFSFFASSVGVAQSYTFTNAGATGRTGPTQAQLNTAYTSTSLDGQVTSVNGIQRWIVPTTGTYLIQAYGAQGGGANGGLGAMMSGEFSLTQNDTIYVLVGQAGLTQSGQPNSVGGGGGTFVVKSPANAVGDILLIAGGGGGSPATYSALRDATTAQNGNNGVGSTASANGGTAGNGGSQTTRSGGGGGYFGNGLPTSGNYLGGSSFTNGGFGGSLTVPGIEGSFGGGGSAYQTGFRGAGGGGGYSGGGAAYVSSDANTISGGGGGSYNSGTNQVNAGGLNTGNGFVVFTYPVPTCLNPIGGNASSITGSSASLDWSSASTSWQVQYGTSGFTLGTGTVTGVLTTKPHTISGLNSLTNYDFYVRNVCSPGDTSNWAGPYSFTTICGITLSGTYTLNGLNPTSGTNFNSFADLAFALNNCGVSGAVTVNVASGTYTEQFNVGQITGSSFFNTVTIQSATLDSTDVILEFLTTTTNHVVDLDGTQYLTFKHMTIRTPTTTTGGGVINLKNGASNITFSNNVLQGRAINSTSTGYAIIFNSSTSTKEDNITISNNRILNGSSAVYMNSTTSTAQRNASWTINNNDISGFYQNGVYLYGGEGSTIQNNKMLTTSATTHYGVYYYFHYPSAECSGNDIQSTGSGAFYGIRANYLYTTSASRGRIHNNFISKTAGTGTHYGISLEQSNWVEVFHNSVNITSGSTSSRSFFLNGGSTNSNSITNNIFQNTGAGYASYVNTPTAVAQMDYNNYRATGTNLAFWSGNQADLNSLKSANGVGYDDNSLDVNPNFVSATDLHCQSAILFEAGTPVGITTDIDGQARSATNPCIGADEFDLNFPCTSPPTAGTINVSSTNPCPGDQVTFTAPQATVGTGSYRQWQVSTVGASGPWNNTGAGDTNLVYSFNPSVGTRWYRLEVGCNSNTDHSSAIQINYNPMPLNGTYTINSSLAASSTNFQSFGAFVSELNCQGISGPVTVNVATGTYSEQIQLGNISGSSATNSITFQSATGDSTDVILQFTTTTAANFVVRFNGANHITFRKMTIRTTTPTTGFGVIDITGGASNITLENNVLQGRQNISGTNYYVINSNVTALAESNITIRNNKIVNGSYGIYINSNSSTALQNTNWVIENNHFENFWTHGFYGLYQRDLYIRGNYMITNSTTTHYGIYPYFSYGTNHINDNEIISTGTGLFYGIYPNYVYGTISDRAQIMNNMIVKTAGTGAHRGIWFNQSNYIDFINNTVHISSGSTASYGMYLNGGTANSYVMRNNILVNNTAGYAAYFQSTTQFSEIDHNCYYKDGTTNLAFWGAARANLAALQTASGAGRDDNSISVLPNFMSTTDARINGAKVLAIQPHPLVLTDIDGKTRCGITDIGASHTSSGNNDIGVSQTIHPNNGVAGAGAQDVVVVIQNFGANTVTSADVHFTDGTITRTINWTGSLAPCDTAIVTFTGANQYTFSGTWNMSFYTSLPNGTADSDNTNDTISQTGCVGMMGNYTIDQSGSGPTNFTSFDAAITAMNSCGIAGSVHFAVSAGTYSGQIDVPAITGATANNTVTFEGVSMAACTLTHATSTATNNRHVVRFNETQFITFRNFTIRSTSSAGWLVHFVDGTDNTLSNCKVEFTVTNATSTNYIPVLISGSTTSNTTTSTISDNILIDSCTISSGYYGVYSRINNGSNSVIVSNSTFENIYYYGVYFQNPATYKVLNNSIDITTPGTTASMGVYLNGVTPAGSNFNQINNNKITNAGRYGIYLSTSHGSTSSSVQGEIYNNMIGGGFRYTSNANPGTVGIYSTNTNNYNIYHNSINQDANSTSLNSAAVYINTGTNVHVMNNHMAITGTSSLAMPMIANNTTTIQTLDYNNYFNSSNANLVRVNTNTYTANDYLNAFPNGGGSNSINDDPQYTSNLDLTSAYACAKGFNLTTQVPLDINGLTRPNPPVIGVNEVTSLPNNDIGLVELISPTFPVTAGSHPITIAIRNFGGNTISSANLTYVLGNNIPVNQSWTGSLLSCDSIHYTFPSPVSLSAGSYAFTAYTSFPNASVDVNTANDTISTQLCPVFNGTYTIGATGDFPSFGSAISALQCGGMNGPVVFNVQSGTYTEQVEIPAIPGASPTNTVTFQSLTGNPNDVTLTFNITTTASLQNFVLRLNAAEYVHLRNFTITATSSTSAGTAVYIDNNASNDTLYNMTLNSIVTTSTSNAVSVFRSPTNTVSHYITLDSCRINNGSYGTYFYSNTSTTLGASSMNYTVRNCVFTDQYIYGMYNYNLQGLIIEGNIIQTTSSSTSYRGIYNYWILIPSDAQRPFIVGNQIKGASGGWGIHNQYVGVNSTMNANRRPLIANNMIQIGSGSSTSVGIYELNAYGADYIYNSVHHTSTDISNTSLAGYFASTNTGANNKTVLLNNVFASSGGAAAIRINNLNAHDVVNFNNLHTTGAVLGYQNTTARNTMNDWQTNTGFDANSKNGNPAFASIDDLHSTSVDMFEGGFPTPLVLDDYDMEVRSTTAPCIGADEYVLVQDDAGIVSIEGLSTICSGSFPIEVRLRNYGLDPLNTVQIQWSVNNTPQTPLSFSGTLAPSQDTVLSLGNFTFSYNTNYTIVVNTHLPNGVADQDNNNDTLTFNGVSNGLNGTYTVGGASADFANLQAAAAALANGICGPVVFNFDSAAGPYTADVQIGVITGGSSTNTVTFNGNGSILNEGTTTSFFDLVGASHITINNFNMVAVDQNSTLFAILLRNQSEHITISNNTINMGVASTSTVRNGICATNSTTSYATGGNNARYVTIDNNTIIGGYSGIRLNGTSSYLNGFGHVISNNTIRDFYVYGIWLQDADSSIIHNNDVSRPNRTTTYYGIYALRARNTKITNNKVHTTTTTSACYGIWVSTSQNTVGFETEIVNNLIYGLNTTSTAYPLYLSGTRDRMNIYHNTVDMDGSLNGTKRAFFLNGAPNNHAVRNNIFTLRGTGGTGAKHLIYVGTTSASFSSNNNVYHIETTSGTNSVGFWTANRTSLNDWQTASSQDANSVSANPNYLNVANGVFVPLSTTIDDIGVNVGVTTDIAGSPRSATTPDAGAYEFTGANEDLAVVGASLINSLCYNSNDTLEIIIENSFGSAVDFSLDPINIGWSVQGPVNSSGTEPITSGSLALNDLDTIRIAGVDLSQPGNYTFSVWIDSNFINQTTFNDSLMNQPYKLDSIIRSEPKYTLINSTVDSVILEAKSPLFVSTQTYDIDVANLLNLPFSSGGNTYYGTSNQGFQWTDNLPSNAVITNVTLEFKIGIECNTAPSTRTTSLNSVAQSNFTSSTYHCSTTSPGPASFVTINLNPANYNVGSNNVFAVTNGGTFGFERTALLNNNFARITVEYTTGVGSFEWKLNSALYDTNTTTVAGPYTTNGIYDYVAELVLGCGTYRDTARVEVVLPGDDAGISQLVSPVNNGSCSGSQNVEVRVSNFGTNVLTSVEINWSLNATPQTPLNITGMNIQPGADTIIQLGTMSLDAITASSIVAWTSNPNAAVDANAANDTLTANNITALLGGATYTIGASGNFTSFNNALAKLYQGVCGPVVFEVANGTYTEQITIDTIPNVSSVNTVTFRSASGDSTSVIVQHAANAANFNWTLRLNGADYIRFERMTLRATGASFGRVVEFINEADNNEITNCVIETNTTSTGSNFAGVFATSSSLNHNNRIANNRFIGGYYGVYFYGINTGVTQRNIGLIVENNDFIDYYYSGVFVYFADAAIIHNNRLANRSNSNTLYPMYLFYLYNTSQITNNVINSSSNGTGTYHGINLTQSVGTTTQKLLVANNVIAHTGATSTGTTYGLYTNGSSHVNVVHNTVFLNNNPTTIGNSRAYFNQNGSNLTSINNIYHNESGGYAFYTSSTTAFITTDYNNFYTTGTNVAFWGGNRTTLAVLQANNGSRDQNSISEESKFIGSTFSPDYPYALSDVSPCIDAGTNTLPVTLSNDLRGSVRILSGGAAVPTADMGAIEYILGEWNWEWTGAINTLWSIGGNWNRGTPPGANQTASISSAPTNQPLVASNEVINRLIVQSGASVTINAFSSLTVEDTIVNNGTITVEHSGSLIQTHTGTNNNTGNGTYVIKKTGNQQANRYNVWSSPVVDTIKVWNVFTGTNPCDVYVFEPSTQSWKWPYPSGYQTTCMSSNVTFSASHVLTGMNGSMWAGRGYYVPGNGTQATRTFNGNVNNGTITTPVALGPNPTGAAWSGSNWNLVGNPYPSSINANDFWQENAVNNSRVSGALYFWNDNGTGSNYSENDYASWNTLGGVQGPNGGATPNGHIASGQGFWVIANSNTNLTFNNSMRSSVNNQFFGASETFPRIWIDVAFDTLVKSQALIAFPEDGTNEHDALYDAPKLQSNQQVYLASRINTQDLVIQGLEPLRFTSTRKRVPLTFKTQLQGVHRIEMFNQDNMDRIAVYLHDAENDSLHLIQASSYVFTPDSVGEYKERFALWFMHKDMDEHVGEIGIDPGVDNPSTGIANANDERGFKVIARNEQIVIKSKGSSRIKHIVLTDMQGRTIREGDGKNGVRYELNTGRIATAVYFVRITDERGELSVEKVFIK